MPKFISFQPKEVCNNYKKKENIVDDEGGALGTYYGHTEDECKTKCSETDGCKNFRYCPDTKKCYLKDKKISESSPEKSNTQCYTIYQDCDNGILTYLYA